MHLKFLLITFLSIIPAFGVHAMGFRDYEQSVVEVDLKTVIKDTQEQNLDIPLHKISICGFNDVDPLVNFKQGTDTLYFRQIGISPDEFRYSVISEDLKGVTDDGENICAIMPNGSIRTQKIWHTPNFRGGNEFVTYWSLEMDIENYNSIDHEFMDNCGFDAMVADKRYLPNTYIMAVKNDLIVNMNGINDGERIVHEKVDGGTLHLLNLHKKTLYYLLSNFTNNMALYKKVLCTDRLGTILQSTLLHVWHDNDNKNVVCYGGLPSVNESGHYMVCPYVDGVDVVDLTTGSIKETYPAKGELVCAQFFNNNCFIVDDIEDNVGADINIYKIGVGLLWKIAVNPLLHRRVAIANKNYIAVHVIESENPIMCNYNEILIWKIPAIGQLETQKKMLLALQKKKYSDMVVITHDASHN